MGDLVDIGKKLSEILLVLGSGDMLKGASFRVNEGEITPYKISQVSSDYSKLADHFAQIKFRVLC